MRSHKDKGRGRSYTVKTKRWKLEFFDLDGDERIEDGDGNPGEILLRADLFYRGPGQSSVDADGRRSGWAQPRDSSFCTMAGADTATDRELTRAAHELFKELDRHWTAAEPYNRRVMEFWTWRSYDNLPADSNSWDRLKLTRKKAA